MRWGLFGKPDWNKQGQEWLGGDGSFQVAQSSPCRGGRTGSREIAHAYAVAVLGLDGFWPFLNGYILAHEPLFDSTHIGVYSSEATEDCLHHMDLQVANIITPTKQGMVCKSVYVVYIRLFAYQASPSILVTVGWPKSDRCGRSQNHEFALMARRDLAAVPTPPGSSSNSSSPICSGRCSAITTGI